MELCCFVHIIAKCETFKICLHHTDIISNTFNSAN